MSTLEEISEEAGHVRERLGLKDGDRYRHYRNKKVYRVIGLARSTEAGITTRSTIHLSNGRGHAQVTYELWQVLYTADGEENGFVWSRPVLNFFQLVHGPKDSEDADSMMPRFEKVTE